MTRSIDPVDWALSDRPVPYETAVAFMEERVQRIAQGEAPELIWLLEHPALYTAGTSAKPSDLLTPHRFPVHQTGRGGQLTYHGPGQRVAYVMLNVRQRSGDVRHFVAQLESWVIATLAGFNIKGEVRPGRVGVWVPRPSKGARCEEKIAAIGIRLRRWISFHGLSLNVDPDLEHYTGIVPCGIREHGVTSFADLGLLVSMDEVDMALKAAFELRFGPTRRVAAPLQT